METLLFDLIPLVLCLWFIKSYFFHYKMTEEEALIVREAPKCLLYPVTALLCVMLLLYVAFDWGWVPGVVQKDIFTGTITVLMLWLALVLYVKWNWGVHVEDKAIRNKNKKQMLMLLLLMGFLLTLL